MFADYEQMNLPGLHFYSQHCSFVIEALELVTDDLSEVLRRPFLQKWAYFNDRSDAGVGYQAVQSANPGGNIAADRISDLLGSDPKGRPCHVLSRQDVR